MAVTSLYKPLIDLNWLVDRRALKIEGLALIALSRYSTQNFPQNAPIIPKDCLIIFEESVCTGISTVILHNMMTQWMLTGYNGSLTLGAHAHEGYGSHPVCLSVCVSVCYQSSDCLRGLHSEMNIPADFSLKDEIFN